MNNLEVLTTAQKTIIARSLAEDHTLEQDMVDIDLITGLAILKLMCRAKCNK